MPGTWIFPPLEILLLLLTQLCHAPLSLTRAQPREKERAKELPLVLVLLCLPLLLRLLCSAC